MSEFYSKLFTILTAPSTTNIVSIISMLATSIAATGAVLATRYAQKSAKATNDTVILMAEDQRLRVRPLISIEFIGGNYETVWQIDPPFIATKSFIGAPPNDIEGPPKLRITNFGGGAALNICITFDLIQNESIVIDGAVLHKATNDNMASLLLKDSILAVNKKGRSTQLTKCGPKDQMKIPHCGAGESKTLHIPEAILNYAFIKALHTPQPVISGKISDDPIQAAMDVRAAFKPALTETLTINIEMDSQIEKSIIFMFESNLEVSHMTRCTHNPLKRDQNNLLLIKSCRTHGQFLDPNDSMNSKYID